MTFTVSRMIIPKMTARVVSSGRVIGPSRSISADCATTTKSFVSRRRSSIRDGDAATSRVSARSEEHTSELQSRGHLVCRLLLEKKKHNASEQGQGQSPAHSLSDAASMG